MVVTVTVLRWGLVSANRVLRARRASSKAAPASSLLPFGFDSVDMVPLACSRGSFARSAGVEVVG